MNEKVDIEIAKRRLTVEMEGFNPLQIMELARQVHEKIEQVASRTKIADSSRLAILAALEIAAELNQVKDAQAIERNAVENKISEFAAALKGALAFSKRQS
ncbi:MAG: cell division protein ZapA [Elusimicrobia bacterium]|nr:cell division protein ZapA [Elusimicrobiota bacterium]